MSQRLLPLRCVICRAKILRLKQTTHGGISTGAVRSSKHHYGGQSATPTNPFYISPASSPVSPVTEVFREQRAVWVKNYDAFGDSPSPSAQSSVDVSATIAFIRFAFMRLLMGANCEALRIAHDAQRVWPQCFYPCVM